MGKTRPTTIDKLYGAGTAAELLEAFTSDQLGTPTIATEVPIKTPHGAGVQVSIEFASGAFTRLDCYPDMVWWQALRGVKRQSTGLNRRAHKQAVPVLAARGAKLQRAAPGDEAAEKKLMTYGSWKRQPDGTLAWKVR